MRNFLKRSVFFVLTFCLFFILINTVYLVIIAKTDWDFKKRLESLNFKDPEFDLLVLGASLAMDGVDTEYLTSKGIKSYNLAIGGSSLKTNYLQLEEYLSLYSHRPTTVLLGTNSHLESFNDNGVHPIVEATTKGYKPRVSDIPIIKFKWLGFEFLKKIVSAKHRQARLSYGQLKFDKTVSDITSFNNLTLSLEKYESLDWMGNLANLCVQYGIKLIVIDMPGYNETRNESCIGPYKLNFNNGTSADLYNFNSKSFCEIFNPESDWVGKSHLNSRGAGKLTEEILKIINM